MTWSIIFHEKESGRIAIAVATKFFAVGARVPHVEPRKGAICTQALMNPLYGPHGLRLIREGVGAADVVRILVTPDAGREHRQVHVMGADSKFAAHTGAECVPWCGHWIGEDMSVAGNMLAGPQVVSETVRFFRENASMPLPRRLIGAMKGRGEGGGGQAGQAVGGAGDLRQQEIFGARPARRRSCRAVARAGAARIGEPRALDA